MDPIAQAALALLLSGLAIFVVFVLAGSVVWKYPGWSALVLVLLILLGTAGCATDHRTSEQKYRDLKAAEQAARSQQWQLRRFRP